MIAPAQNNTRFLDEISSIPGGEKIRRCYQCGTCSASCPMVAKMQYSPRKLFAMSRAGMRDEVLSSNSMWYCVSCYSCQVRCPRGINLTDIMYLLKRLSIHEGLDTRSTSAAALSRSFVQVVNKYGRNHETELLMQYYLRSGPWKALRLIPLALKLFLKKRIPLFPQRIKKAGLGDLRKIIEQAKILGGEQ